jgi:hypothetical protein
VIAQTLSQALGWRAVASKTQKSTIFRTSSDIRPGNSQEECTNGCKNSARPGCQQFCDCIYNQGKPLNACLAEYQKAKKTGADH